MKFSKSGITTTKSVPNDAELKSHQLMIRAGMIKKLASGLYTWMPLGLRVLKKIENIIRHEMNKIGALEILMPAIQPSELWKESGRWEKYGPELLRIKDRNERARLINIFNQNNKSLITKSFTKKKQIIE